MISEPVHAQQLNYKALRNEVLACEFNVEDPQPPNPPVRRLNVSLDAHFVQPVHEQAQEKKRIANKAIFCFCDAAFRTKDSVVMSTSWCQ